MPNDAFSKAVELLAGREKNRAKLEASLRTRGFDDAEIDAALKRLVELGYLDELRVASSRAAAELKSGRSRAGAEQRLVAQGFDEPDAQAAVARAADESGHDDLSAAKALLAKKKLTGAKAARFLASRGFDEDLIRQLVPSVDGAGDDG